MTDSRDAVNLIPVPAKIKIEYCVQCGWLLRAGWMAQELLSTFGDKIGELALVPSSGGVFRVSVGDGIVWSRENNGGFPSAAELKRLVRDRVAPDMPLGHVDEKTEGS
ncbi:MAG: SelT/SelW/SelH family protein [Candidatus Mycalebacterium zealandia]|nr:MAG: SelT/SelW/SelH family protein [Candidatus Mycalebacterium zealandia]